jgi:predicted enzyme related to lactoylglutathione lyase
MINGLGGVSLWSSDLNNLLPFYRDTLGLKVAVESERFVLLGDDEQAPSLGLGSHSEISGPTKDPYRCMVGLSTSDIRGDFKRLKAAGVEFIEEPNDAGDGLMLATLKDPEGNLVQLFEFAS